MAYVFDFPSDVTALVYSMRDPKNWNGDKFRGGSTRPAADWFDQHKDSYRPGLTVCISIRLRAIPTEYAMFEALDYGEAQVVNIGMQR